ncbi:nitroreductase family protein [Methylomonas sp. AM2-LC]|uniref:nitroreductase family protein n=1 Tax=Methylomonas sp. AM2-LC TaxID=3153301 RepID=UPI0032661B5F
MQHKLATTQVQIDKLIASRWSPRAFAADQPISNTDLIALLEAARWSPSCFNDQPWRFIVCNKHTHASAWEKAFSVIVEKNQLWAKNAPLLLLSVAMNNFSHNDKPNRWASYDTGAASLSLCLQANALGLVSHQMGGFDAEQAKQVFNLPDNATPMAMIAVGYQADVNQLANDFQSAEAADRSRNALTKQFFAGAWDEELLLK